MFWGVRAIFGIDVGVKIEGIIKEYGKTYTYQIDDIEYLCYIH